MWGEYILKGVEISPWNSEISSKVNEKNWINLIVRMHLTAFICLFRLAGGQHLLTDVCHSQFGWLWLGEGVWNSLVYLFLVKSFKKEGKYFWTVHLKYISKGKYHPLYLRKRLSWEDELENSRKWLQKWSDYWIVPSKVPFCFFQDSESWKTKGKIKHIFSEEESIFQKQECIHMALKWLVVDKGWSSVDRGVY